MHTEVWLGNLKERDHPEYLVIDGEIIFTYILTEMNRMVWTVCSLVLEQLSDCSEKEHEGLVVNWRVS